MISEYVQSIRLVCDESMHVCVIQVKKYFEKTGYTCTTDAKPVHVQAQLDEEIVTTTVQDNTSGWSVEKQRQVL